MNNIILFIGIALGALYICDFVYNAIIMPRPMHGGDIALLVSSMGCILVFMALSQ